MPRWHTHPGLAALALALTVGPGGAAASRPLRAAAEACRAGLFEDGAFAADLRRFLLAASAAAAPSGNLYPPSSVAPVEAAPPVVVV